MEKMNGLDLFSGYGGLTLALEPWVKPVAYIENKPYAQGILLSRMADSLIPWGPIWDDVRTFKKGLLPITQWPEIIYAGFPCQGNSCAGVGKGLDDIRTGLFFEIMRLAEEVGPKFLFLENVTGLRKKSLHAIGRALADAGYDCRWFSLSAQEVGANHKRARWWLLARRVVANPYSDGQSEEAQGGEEKNPKGNRKNNRRATSATFKRNWWATEPNVDRVDDGTKYRMDRIEALGNGVVPLQARAAFCELSGLDFING